MAITSSALRQLSGGDGTMLGQSAADPIRFYGAFGNSSGISQLTIVGTTLAGFSTAAVLANQTTAATGSTWGFSTQAQADFVISTCVQLWKLGIIG